jgi:hypothetical protein
MAKWTQGSGIGPESYYCILRPGLGLSVHWESIERLPDSAPRYNVVVFGKLLAVRQPDAETGKLVAEGVAKKWLEESLKALKEK